MKKLLAPLPPVGPKGISGDAWVERRSQERRLSWLNSSLVTVALLRVLLDAEDALPTVEVPPLLFAVLAAFGSSPGWYDQRRLTYAALRKAEKLGLVESERRKYENVTRWGLTTVGVEVLDALASVHGTDAEVDE